MIGTFWNLCRACPAVPDKLHSEYRSTYRWHEYTGPRQQEVVRGQPPPAPAPALAPPPAPAPEPEPPRLRPPGGARRVAHEDHLRADAPDNSEPILPRRRKHPALAYRCHEVLGLGLTAAASEDCLRSEEQSGPQPAARGRGAHGRRSRSEGPPGGGGGGLGVLSPEPSPQVVRRARARARARGPRGAILHCSRLATHSDSEPDEGPDMMVAAGPTDVTAAEVPAAGLPSTGAVAGPGAGAGAGSSDRHEPTEYRLQFAWPPSGRRSRVGGGAAARMQAVVHSAMASRPAAGKASGMAQTAAMAAPRKSLSMDALRQQQRSRATEQDRTDGHDGESEPLMAAQDHGDSEELRGEEKIREEAISKEEKPRHRKEFKTEYKKKFRPFSQYDYVEGRFLKKKEEEAQPLAEQPAQQQPQPVQGQGQGQAASWYAEVIELRKKAGEYKHRGWGTELVPEHISELYSKQMLVWEQVSRRSSLSALSLAAVATPRSISKEEKEKENSRRTSPTKPSSLGRTRPHTAQPKLPGVHEAKPRKSEKTEDNKKEAPPRSSRKEFPLRHHLEKTTGAEDGAIILSPTREKLEPVVPRRREDPTSTSSPKRLAQTGRSQSLGPSGAPASSSETRSPKRTPRAPSATPRSQPPVQQERRPRPTTLNTTAPSRSKSRTSAPSKGEQQAPVNKSQPSAGRAAASSRGDHKAVPARARARPASGEQEQEEEPEPEVDLEPIVKSPPEPTRVKSPEQIIMRSPEPVNWTVPLDTGKTFTVTQNVPDAERPHPTSSPAPSAAAAKTAETAAPKPAPRRPDPSTAVGSTDAKASAGATTATSTPKSEVKKPEPPPSATAASTGAKKDSAPTAPPPAKSDPMTTSIMGSLSESTKSDPMTSSTIGSSYSATSIPKSDPTTQSNVSGSSLKSDPMATSMTGSSIAGSSLKSDPMAMSMTASSVGGSSLKSDPMATSMMGSSLGGSSLKSDPMATSMMGSSIGSSFDPMSSSMMGSSIGSSKADPMSASMTGSRDPMTTSMIGSLGGSSRSDPMTTSVMGSGLGTVNGMDDSSSKATGASGQTSSLSGTTLRCLEDPSFSFDSGKNVTPAARGVEAPQVPPPQVGGSGGYRVLEAPTPAQSSVQPSSNPADVLDSARDRFDKFWGKEKDEKL